MTALLPCPFCGNTEPEFERIGTPRQSCIVACGNCGARHESSDEGEDSGTSWNRRAQTAQAVPLLSDAEIEAAWYECDNYITQRAYFDAGVHWAQKAVRAKLGAGVPMTDQQISRLYAESWSTSSAAAFHQAVRAAERHHGIVDKEGA